MSRLFDRRFIVRNTLLHERSIAKVITYALNIDFTIMLLILCLAFDSLVPPRFTAEQFVSCLT